MQCDCHRHDADQRQAQHSVEQDSNAELRPHLRHEQAEDEEDEEVEELSPVLGELDAVHGDLAEAGLRGTACDERGDEHARPR